MTFAPLSPGQALMQTGFQLWEQGRLEDAWNTFHEVLRIDPNQALALHMVGLIAMQAGQLEIGVDYMRRSIAAHPTDPVAYSNLGGGLRDLGRSEEALAAFDQALAMAPDFADAFNNRAILFGRLGRHAEALADYDRAVALQPRAAPLHNNRGDALRGLGRGADAIASYQRATEIDPALTVAWYNLAGVLADTRKLQDALAAIDRALVLDPGMADAHVNRGNILIDLGRESEALDSFDRALSLLGTAKDGPAVGSAASGAGSLARILNNRANALRMLDRYPEALESCDRAIQLDPDCSDAWVTKAIILGETGRDQEGVAAYEACLRRWPELAAAGFGCGLAYLALGDFDKGWPLYEDRFDIKGTGAFVVKRQSSKPYWLGKAPLAGKTILLQSEQGLGDTLHFCRYANLAKKAGARVVIEAQAPLVRLLRSLEGADLVVERGAALPDFDLHASIMSLPLAFGTTIDTVPVEVPYLRPDPDMVRVWADRLGERTRPRVGLVWAAGFRPDQPAIWTVRHRDIPLDLLAPLAGTEVEFFSLQKGARAEAELALLGADRWVGPPIRDFTAELNDFAETAALVANLDLVISVCTSTAHLAGALGKPVWILNRFDSCWRWMRERNDSPWYPTAQLFRQKSIGDWTSVVRDVAAALEVFAASH